MKKVILAIFLSVKIFAVCSSNPLAVAQQVTTLDYSAMFPMRIAGIPISQGRMPDSITQVNTPICMCPAPPPLFIRLGIPTGFFNPDRIVDSVKDPYCFVGIGANLGSELSGIMGTKGGDADEPNMGEKAFLQAHMTLFAPFEILGIATDFICLQSPAALDIGYMTEIDPLWNDDILSALISPEGLLFGNPIASLACIADAVSAQIDWANPALFWCKGSWGSVYPMTGSVVSGDFIQSSASAVGNLIYKLHRQNVLWASWGYAALCSKYPAPIWTKDAYRMQLSLPIPSQAFAIGKTGILWDTGKNPAVKGDKFAYILFRKKDCCAF